MLTHTKGTHAGKPFILPGWQKKIVRDIFGTVRRDGLRQYDKAYLEVPKKNGKSELAAGVALYGLFMDDEAGAEVYSAAATREQASQVFKVAAQMVRNRPALLSRCKIVDSTKTIYLKNEPSSFYKAISADAGNQDGINPSMVIFDELHRQKNRNLWDVLTKGSDTRSQPLILAITTAGIEAESPLCWEQHEYARQILEGVFDDPTFYACIFGLAEEEDWTFEGVPAKGSKPATGWYKANPALGDFLRIDRVRADAEKAKRVPSEENSFRRFRLNQWLSQDARWLPLSEWDQCKEPFDVASLVGQRCYTALDISSTQDLSAYVMAFPVGDEVFLLPHFWLPEANLVERSQRDRVPYDVWQKMGLLTLTPGNYIDHAFIRGAIIGSETTKGFADVYQIEELAYDSWNAQQIGVELSNAGLTAFPMRQGFQSLNEPTKSFEKAVLGRKLRHGGNPILRWNLDCVTIASDAAGNIKPVKPDRMKSSKRIDGIVAAIMAHGRLEMQRSKPESAYNDRGILIL